MKDNIINEINLLELKNKNEELIKNQKNFDEKNYNLNYKIQYLEKNNKKLMDQVKQVTDEKNKTINDEKQKTNELIKKCEEFKNDVEIKLSAEHLNKDKLTKDNEMLKSKLEEYKNSLDSIKFSLEEQMNLKNKQSSSIQNDFKSEFLERIEAMNQHSHKYEEENNKYKNEIFEYQKKIEELANQITGFNKKFENSKKEFEKVNHNYIRKILK